MKLKHLSVLFMFTFMLFSCSDDEPFTQVKANERLVQVAIKDHRENNGLNGPFVLQFIMVEEAQIYSFKMAGGTEPLGIQGLSVHWNNIHEKIGGYNEQALVLKTTSGDPDNIFSELLQLPGADSVLLEDASQCGVGIARDTDGNNYVTVLMLKID